MVQLANLLHLDPWFPLPHTATDEYVRNFAALVRARLDRRLTPHVEYTNEVWNGVFTQSRYVMDQGTALGLSQNRFQAGLRFYAQRALAIFASWRRAFGRPFRRVLAAQAANPWTLQQVLDWRNAYRRADEAAVAPYFTVRGLSDPTQATQIRTWSVDRLLDAARQAIRTFVHDTTASDAQLAHARGLPLVAYEGGQSLVGAGPTQNDTQLTNLVIAANRSPRMYGIYTDYLDLWEQLGGALFMNFTDVSRPSQYGSWGALEYLDQDPATAPKRRALLDWICHRPRRPLRARCRRPRAAAPRPR
jgi:hypothetical protein